MATARLVESEITVEIELTENEALFLHALLGNFVVGDGPRHHGDQIWAELDRIVSDSHILTDKSEKIRDLAGDSTAIYFNKYPKD